MTAYPIEALEMLFFAAMFAIASLITIRRNPWISMLMSTTSVLLIGALYMATGPSMAALQFSVVAAAEDDCAYYHGAYRLEAVEPLPDHSGVNCIYN